MQNKAAKKALYTARWKTTFKHTTLVAITYIFYKALYTFLLNVQWRHKKILLHLSDNTGVKVDNENITKSQNVLVNSSLDNLQDSTSKFDSILADKKKYKT